PIHAVLLSRLFAYTTLFRSLGLERDVVHGEDHHARQRGHAADEGAELVVVAHHAQLDWLLGVELARDLAHRLEQVVGRDPARVQDRKSTRLNSSHVKISYAV